MKNKKIVITTDGVETIARFYDGKKVIKSATAKCSPDDTFDFNIGAKIAFERLIGATESEWRVVNRHPKVGDYIRLVGEVSFCFDRVGDILKVDKVKESTHAVYVLGKNHVRDTGDPDWHWFYTRSEFEVVERVSAEEKPKYYNGKVVCVQCDGRGYTVGKVYEFKDGTLVDDDGDVRYGTCPVNHPSDIVNIYKFIPYVE